MRPSKSFAGKRFVKSDKSFRSDSFIWWNYSLWDNMNHFLFGRHLSTCQLSHLSKSKNPNYTIYKHQKIEPFLKVKKYAKIGMRNWNCCSRFSVKLTRLKVSIYRARQIKQNWWLGKNWKSGQNWQNWKLGQNWKLVQNYGQIGTKLKIRKKIENRDKMDKQKIGTKLKIPKE